MVRCGRWCRYVRAIPYLYDRPVCRLGPHPAGDINKQQKTLSENIKFQQKAKEKNQIKKTLNKACAQYALAE